MNLTTEVSPPVRAKGERERERERERRENRLTNETDPSKARKREERKKEERKKRVTHTVKYYKWDENTGHSLEQKLLFASLLPTDLHSSRSPKLHA